MKKIKVLIAGIGGVGGYFGGFLAYHYTDNPMVDVYFLSRGENLLKIQKSGLKVLQGSTAFVARPKLATNNARDVGIVDYAIICTKSFDLEEIIKQIEPCLSDNTIILPLLNGVDNKDSIQKTFPNNVILDGCVYIISRMQRAGVVENSGNIQKLFFGIENYKSKALLSFETLLKEAKIEAVLYDEITKIIWEKYIFISAMAASTSYFDCPIGMVIQNNYQSLLDLIEEVSQLARINNIPVDDRIEALTMKKLRSLPPDATSSLHSDIRNQKKQSELFSLTGYVVEAGARTKVNTPTYRKIYEALK